MVEADTPPVWAESVVLRHGTRTGGGRGRWEMWMTAQAWRTRRMDIFIMCAMEPELLESQTKIFKALVVQVMSEIDWTLNVRVETKIDYPEQRTGATYCQRKIILQVGDGKQLEPVINMLARFKERWSE